MFPHSYCPSSYSRTRATLISGTRRITRTMKSQEDMQSTYALFSIASHTLRINFFYLIAYIYISLFRNSSLRKRLRRRGVVEKKKTKRNIERKSISLLKMERKNEERSSRRPRKPQSWTRTRRENGNSILVAPRFGREAIFAGSTVRCRFCESRARLDRRDGNKYNQRTKRADDSFNVAAK